MKLTKFSFISQCDGLCIHGMCMVPDREVVGVIQLVHGMAEHKERYENLMHYLAQSGYLCVIHDHRGHGESVKSQADLGYFYGVDATYLIEDIHEISMRIKEHFPHVPLFLFGHSMGSLAVRAYCKRYDRDIDGLIVCGSPSENKAAAFGKILCQIMEKVKQDHYRSSFLQRLAFGHHNDGIQDAKSENSWICSDEDVVKEYDEDPLCGFTFTLNGFENLFALMMTVYDKKGWQCHHASMPIYFIAGKQDPCIISEKAFHTAVMLMRKVGYANVAWKLYEGMRHEILNERDKGEVYRDLLKWLNKHTTNT